MRFLQRTAFLILLLYKLSLRQLNQIQIDRAVDEAPKRLLGAMGFLQPFAHHVDFAAHIHPQDFHIDHMAAFQARVETNETA